MATAAKKATKKTVKAPVKRPLSLLEQIHQQVKRPFYIWSLGDPEEDDEQEYIDLRSVTRIYVSENSYHDTNVYVTLCCLGKELELDPQTVPETVNLMNAWVAARGMISSEAAQGAQVSLF